MDANSTAANGFTATVGWQSSPNQRGTLDIIWSCLSTLLLALWTMLHLNVPANSDTWITMSWRKTRWLILGILAPELPMLFACGQYASAKRSVKDMRALGYSEEHWTFCHAFYADSGGYVLQPYESEQFPVTAKQLHYLLAQGHISMPKTSREEIWDKSKADFVTKLVTLLQVGWFVLQIIGRAIQRLPVSPFELSTLALTSSALTTLSFWWHKPLEVRTPIVLSTSVTTVDILHEGGEAAKEPFRDTPLDFVEGKIYMSSKWSRHVLRWIVRAGLQTRPLSRIPNDRDPQANLRQHSALAVGTATFASIHLCGWNFEFASPWERTLWRSCCISVWVLLAIYGTTEMVMCYKENYLLPGLESGSCYKMRWPHCLMFFVPASLYFVARLGLLVVALSSLAALPPGAYQTAQWTNIFPHL